MSKWNIKVVPIMEPNAEGKIVECSGVDVPDNMAWTYMESALRSFVPRGYMMVKYDRIPDE